MKAETLVSSHWFGSRNLLAKKVSPWVEQIRFVFWPGCRFTAGLDRNAGVRFSAKDG